MPGLASTTPQPQELAAHTVGSPVSATSFAQIATAQAAEEERITLALDTAEARARAAAN